MKEIKDLDKWGNTLFHGYEDNIKKPILYNMVYSLNAILIKIIPSYFVNIDN